MGTRRTTCTVCGGAPCYAFLSIQLYYDGQGVKQDYTKAREWWEKAAAQGKVSAQYNLGFLYYDGQGVKKARDRVTPWWEKAAAQGNIDAKEGLQRLQNK